MSALSRFARRRGLDLAAAAVVALAADAAQALPRLNCEVSHAGKSQAFAFAPVADPYRVKAVDIDGRFRFKAVMIGNDHDIEYIKLYTYDLSTDHAVLLHQAKYLSPHPKPAAAPDALTGRQYVYSLKRGREMTFECALVEVGP